MATRKVAELALKVDSKPGELTRVLSGLSEKGVNAIAFCGFNSQETKEAFIMIVPDKDQKALKVAEELGFNAKMNSVVAVTGEAGKGAGAKLAQKLWDAGINIEYAYASTPGS
ncbi:MAG: hypothetical protein QF645_03060, partial [Planctomycetota bacterium]|nr:hypothetical protein [Planctomycetota bacterium]